MAPEHGISSNAVPLLSCVQARINLLLYFQHLRQLGEKENPLQSGKIEKAEGGGGSTSSVGLRATEPKFHFKEILIMFELQKSD